MSKKPYFGNVKLTLRIDAAKMSDEQTLALRIFFCLDQKKYEEAKQLVKELEATFPLTLEVESNK